MEQIIIPEEDVKRIETIMSQEGAEITPELLKEVQRRLKSLWSANLYDDVATVLSYIEEDAENEYLNEG